MYLRTLEIVDIGHLEVCRAKAAEVMLIVRPALKPRQPNSEVPSLALEMNLGRQNLDGDIW